MTTAEEMDDGVHIIKQGKANELLRARIEGKRLMGLLAQPGNDLQNKLDDCRGRLVRQAAHIDDLRERNAWLSNDLIERREIHAKDQTTIDDLIESATYYRRVIAECKPPIDELKGVVLKDRVIKCLESKIALKDKALVAAREIIDKSHRLTAQYKEQNEALKDELSIRKQDSEVLMKVVEAITAYNDLHLPTMRVFDRIAKIVEDYLNTPEPSTEENCITVKVAYLEMP